MAKNDKNVIVALTALVAVLLLFGAMVVLSNQSDDRVSLTVSSSGEGHTTPSGVTYYEKGTTVPISITPGYASEISSVYVDGINYGSIEGLVVTMDQNHKINVKFVDVPIPSVPESIISAGFATVTKTGSNTFVGTPAIDTSEYSVVDYSDSKVGMVFSVDAMRALTNNGATPEVKITMLPVSGGLGNVAAFTVTVDGKGHNLGGGEVEIAFTLKGNYVATEIIHKSSTGTEIITLDAGDVVYDSTTNVTTISFTASHFSEFTVRGSKMVDNEALLIDTLDKGLSATLENDITINQTLLINKSITLDLNEYTLSAPSGALKSMIDVMSSAVIKDGTLSLAKQSDGGTVVINIHDFGNNSPSQVSLDDVIVTSTPNDTSKSTHGINVENTKNLSLSINGTNKSKSLIECTHYAVNIRSGNIGLKIDVVNTSLTGYCAYQSWSKDVVTTFTGCTLKGVNQWSGFGNSFSTIVFNTIGYDGNDGAANNTTIFDNCEIIAIEKSTANESLFSVRSDPQTIVFTSNCIFKVNDTEYEDLNGIKDEWNVYTSMSGAYVDLTKVSIKWENETKTLSNILADYTISSVDDLIKFREDVESVNSKYKNATISLVNDLDLGGINWDPIGDSAYNGAKFTGTFYGNGHSIKNLTITGGQDGIGTEYLGLFSCLDGTVMDLIIENPNITGTHFLGAVAGYSYEDLYLRGCTVKGGSIEAKVVTVAGTQNTYNDGDDVGGLVGYINGGATIRNCEVSGNITLKGHRQVGGLVGGLNATTGSNTLSGNVVKDVTIITDCSEAYVHNTYPAGTTVSSKEGEHDVGKYVGSYITGDVPTNNILSITTTSGDGTIKRYVVSE